MGMISASFSVGVNLKKSDSLIKVVFNLIQLSNLLSYLFSPHCRQCTELTTIYEHRLVFLFTTMFRVSWSLMASHHVRALSIWREKI